MSRYFDESLWINDMDKPVVGVVMGSNSDWPVMQKAVEQLEAFGIAYEAKVVSAHRTPDLLTDYAVTAKDKGLACIIAGAGGAAHLPGMLAAHTTIPVLGVPVPSRYLKGQDSLLSIVQMPKGIPVATFAIGEAGAANAALFAIAQIATNDADLAVKLEQFRQNQHQAVLDMTLPPQ
jgi:5-(carboxyamino)imidazole ribonucleotide mutase